MITQQYLQQMFDYDPNTGIFTNKESRHGVSKGKQAGTLFPNGYVYIMIKGKRHLAHRLAWLYMTGTLPKFQIDHKNGIRSDNRWLNLREATTAQNSQNKKHKSKVTGTYFNKKAKKWVAQIMINYKNHYLGLYNTQEEAHAAYCEAKSKYHKFQPVLR